MSCDDDIAKMLEELGLEMLHSTGGCEGWAHGGSTTVVMGGMPVGHVTYNTEKTRWEFTSGEPEMPFITARPLPDTAPNRRAKKVRFVAVCDAFPHPTESDPGVMDWFGPVRPSHSEARADADGHEHPRWAYVSQV